MLGFFVMVSAAQAVTPLQSLYGALYYGDNLSATSGANSESILLSAPDGDGFIAITTNNSGAEWWTSDPLGLEWTLSESNPLEEYNCRQPGRHSAVEFAGDAYFGAACDAGAYIFKVTGLETIEEITLVETVLEGAAFGDPPPEGDSPPEGDGPGGDPGCTQFPTATVLGDSLYMFCNNAFVEYDGTTATYITDAVNQGDGVPLEASTGIDGSVYLAGTGNNVTSFNGTGYEFIGTVDEASLLPAVGAFNGSVYVGDLDNENGAAIYKLNADSEFDLLFQLDVDDGIINKMQPTDDGEHLVFYTANTNGTNIFAINTDDELVTLVGGGLGGDDPGNNSEVVSILSATVTDGKENKKIMLFGTQNNTDETKIFILNVEEDLAIEMTKSLLAGPAAKSLLPKKKNDDEKSVTAVKKKKASLRRGQKVKVQIKKKFITKGDKLQLLINGTAVKTVTVKKKKKVTITFRIGKAYKSKKNISVSVAVNRKYGSGEQLQLSTNSLAGKSIKLKLKKKQ